MEGVTVKKTAILLSGGMDSYALTYKYRPDIAITINYGQLPANAEYEAAKTLTDSLQIDQVFLDIDLSSLGSGDLIGKSADTLAPASDWWPFRNQALITLAAMKLISYDVRELMIASVASDEVHKDGTQQFVDAMNEVLSIQEGNIQVTAPALTMTTEELIRESKIPLSLLGWAHSCHTSNIACGFCRGCNKQRNVLVKLGYMD